MIVEKGKKILIICMIVVFLSILIAFIIDPKPASFVGGFLLFGLFFFFTYWGYNWSRICLFILLLILGLAGQPFQGVVYDFFLPASSRAIET
jgi:hypothetical protein